MRAWLIWWAALTVLYWLLVFKTEPAELVAGAVCGAISATGTELVRRHGSVRFAPGWGWLPSLLTLPRLIVQDTLRLVGVLWRVIVRREDVRGRFVALPFKGAHGGGARGASRRAIAKFVGSVAPNSLVVGFADRHNRILLHELMPTDEPPRCDPWERP
jgi:multisubunit Na+/H+ antiporter MnhE subunit